ncbi:MAG: YbaB/EbfC family nucleoid-associated protein [Desulfovibrionaceae bacterium]|nr:YbaB/EbfC family nucleoid-associated protein [Desulfovibrionaceae bacterium]
MIRMNKLLEQAQSMKKKLESLQEELKTKTVEATSGGGIVSVTVNGEHAITALHIDPIALQDKDMLQDLIITAINDAQKKVKGMIEEHMSSVTGGFSIPGLL